MIVKVQLAFNNNDVLVYNQDKSFLYEGEATPAIHDVMKGEYKKYFYAEVRGDTFNSTSLPFKLKQICHSLIIKTNLTIAPLELYGEYCAPA